VQPPAVRGGDSLDDRQPEAGAPPARAAPEALERLREATHRVRRQLGACVGHGDTDLVAARRAETRAQPRSSL
jgi:hypothetical protein